MLGGTKNVYESKRGAHYVLDKNGDRTYLQKTVKKVSDRKKSSKKPSSKKLDSKRSESSSKRQASQKK